MAITNSVLYQHSAKSLYPNFNILSTLEETKVEPDEAAQLEVEGSPEKTFTKNKTAKFMWLGVLILFVILFQFSKG